MSWGKRLIFIWEVLVAFHGGHEIEVFDVNCHELGVVCIDETVEEKLDGEKVCCRRSTVIWVVDEIVSHSGSCVIRIYLF